jgi:CDP-diacylglycerol--serine O-phosphatidyltransferase
MDISKLKYLAPNSLTLSSLFCGFASLHVAHTATSARQFSIAAWLIVASMLFDLFDGRVARMTKAESELGVQLDSLADAVSFGVAPGTLLYLWGLESYGMVGMIPAFVYVACAIVRLARFNVMASQHEGPMRYFFGLPTPLAAGAVVSIVMSSLALTDQATTQAGLSVAALSMLLGGLMVSNIRYRTFKDVNLRGRAGAGLLVLAVTAVGLGVVFKPSVAFVAIMFLYIIVGMVGGVVEWSRAILGADSESEQHVYARASDDD